MAFPTVATYRIRVDWDANGNFTGTYDDITIDVVFCTCRLGRDRASQLTARSVAGSATLTLANDTGKYSRFLSTGPLFGLMLPGRRIQIETLTPTAAVIWTGEVDNVQPAGGAEIPMATLTASGIFKKLAKAGFTALPQMNVQSGTVIGAILDAADHPAGDRIIDAGEVPVGNWYKPADTKALGALQEIEELEMGFLREGLAFDVVFEGRYNRVLNHQTSQGTFSDDPADSLTYLVGIEQDDPLREIFNQFSAEVTPTTTNPLAVLWTLSPLPLVLSPGQSITYVAKPNTNGLLFVSSWTTPVVGTDIVQTGVADGDIGVTVVKGALDMKITAINNHATANATISLFQARGVAIIRGDEYLVTALHTTSRDTYGLSTYPIRNPFFPNANYAQAACDFGVARYKDPHPTLKLRIPAGTEDALFAQAVQRKLSDRITVKATKFKTMLGISSAFYIEAIEHSFGARSPLETTWEVAEADPTGINQFWILGDSTYGVLGSTTILAY